MKNYKGDYILRLSKKRIIIMPYCKDVLQLQPKINIKVSKWTEAIRQADLLDKD